jgi:hypothetical protein
MIPISMRQIALAAAGASAVLAFAAGWWGNDDGSRRKLAASATPDWVLPKPIVTELSGFTKILAQRAPFGAPADLTKPAPAGPQTTGPGTAAAAQWRVGGIVTSEKSRYLVVLIRRPGENTTRAEMRKPGEELPDGSIIRAVEPADVTIDRQGTIIRIKMFAQN